MGIEPRKVVGGRLLTGTQEMILRLLHRAPRLPGGDRACIGVRDLEAATSSLPQPELPFDALEQMMQGREPLVASPAALQYTLTPHGERVAAALADVEHGESTRAAAKHKR
jgi:hypothetical protein